MTVLGKDVSQRGLTEPSGTCGAFGVYDESVGMTGAVQDRQGSGEKATVDTAQGGE